jgi:hypothetical protein
MATALNVNYPSIKMILKGSHKGPYFNLSLVGYKKGGDWLEF